jgi:pilus assembly protein CpaB
MRTNNVAILVLAIVIGGVAALLTRQWLQSHASAAIDVPKGTIVVAKAPLGFGSELTADNVVEVNWAAASLPEGAFATKQELLGDGRRIVLSGLDRNEPVLRSKITAPGQRGSLSTLLQDGKRAVTVRVDDVRGVAGFILPGDSVDIVLIRADEGSRRENYSEILLQQVRVLAIDQLASERQEQPTVAKAVTLEVTPEQAQKVLLASNVGKLSLILRQPGEKDSRSTQRVTERDLGDTPPKPVTPLPTVASAPPPPPQVTKTLRPAAVTVAIVHGLKREEYSVRQENGGLIETEESGSKPAVRQDQVYPMLPTPAQGTRNY